mmetsp:Transcript_16304/g.23227  ORF Transcript_16304/g.23227 Transcript_16304/m.23227 type:complete len:445 (-) Transcript_16304:85-1419(-)
MKLNRNDYNRNLSMNINHPYEESDDCKRKFSPHNKNLTNLKSSSQILIHCPINHNDSKQNHYDSSSKMQEYYSYSGMVLPSKRLKSTALFQYSDSHDMHNNFENHPCHDINFYSALGSQEILKENNDDCYPHRVVRGNNLLSIDNSPYRSKHQTDNIETQNYQQKWDRSSFEFMSNNLFTDDKRDIHNYNIPAVDGVQDFRYHSKYNQQELSTRDAPIIQNIDEGRYEDKKIKAMQSWPSEKHKNKIYKENHKSKQCFVNNTHNNYDIEKLQNQHRQTVSAELFTAKALSNRTMLSFQDDCKFISPFLCFLRSQCLEVFEANMDFVELRYISKKIKIRQVGIRCVFCSSVPLDNRANRSSCFPSSLDKIYQSVTMMIHDHMFRCEEIPIFIRHHLKYLKKRSCKGLTRSRKYWCKSAENIGLVNANPGIIFKKCTEIEKSANQL